MRLRGDIHGKGVVLLVGCPLVLSTSAHVVFWDCNGPQGAKGQSKDYEVDANCIGLLIMLCLWERWGLCTNFVANGVALLRGEGGG